MKLIQILSDIMCNTLLDPAVMKKCRMHPGDFSRNTGKLPYLTLIKLLLKNSKHTISASLDEFFSNLCAMENIPLSEKTRCSQQAFSKARKKLSPKLFKICFDRMLDFLCSKDSLAFHKRFEGLWGLQIIAIDGSKIPLPNRKVLLDKYGSIGRGSSSPTAIASIAYDVLNQMVLEADIDIMHIDERTLAKRHLENIKSKARTDLLYTMFVFDRGYASKNLLTFIEDEIKARYLFRLRNKFNVEIDALPDPVGDEICDYTIHLFDRNIRVLKFRLSSGVVETLITNEFGRDKNQFKILYFMRWPVEGCYKLIKEKIGLTNFRGYSENSILQEFWISLILANLSFAIKRETDGIIKYESMQKKNKHEYQTNMNELIGHLSRYFDRYIDADTLSEKRAVIKEIITFAVSHKVIDKKANGESYPRNEPRKVKHHYNVKNTH